MICESPAPVLPDGFTGALLGLESFQDITVLLHGPTGCRGPHSAMSERLYPRSSRRERMNYADHYFFGQPRIPTTALDSRDIVFGAIEKLEDALQALPDQGPIGIINSPGTALIGDDLRACVKKNLKDRPCAVVEMPALSQSFAEGYQQGVLAFLDALKTPQTRHGGDAIPKKPQVALVGLSIAHAHWEGSVLELKRLLELCGMEVACTLGAQADWASCQRLSEVDVLAVVHSCYADRLEGPLRQRYRGKWAQSPAGAPIGFDATETWIKVVAHGAGLSPDPALEDIRYHRKRLAHLLEMCLHGQDLFKGHGFAIRLDGELALPLAQWLYEHLGLLPLSLEMPPGPFVMQAREWLSAISCQEVLHRRWQESGATLLFSDGFTAFQAAARGMKALEIIFPVEALPDFLPRPLLGARGALMLAESVLKGLPTVL